MIIRNKKLRRSLGWFFLLGTLLITGAFFYSPTGGLWMLLSWSVFAVFFLITEWQRYKELQKISRDLEQLLLHGIPLPIALYEEGELSVLAYQVQKLTQKLTEAKKALQKDKAFLADSLADISHQLRTPLTAMHLTLSLLRETENDPKRHRELIRDFRNLLDRTQWLVEALLKLSKLDAGTLPFHPEEVSLSQLLDRAVAPFAIPLELQEQSLNIQCRECTLFCDPIWTAEAIGNVLKNAIEHTPAGKEILIVGRDTAIYTEIVVKDQGKGFTPEELPRLFERFYRGSRESVNSCGIGLSLCQSILAAQNGSIQAQNWEQGGQFTIKFYKQLL